MCASFKTGFHFVLWCRVLQHEVVGGCFSLGNVFFLVTLLVCVNGRWNLFTKKREGGRDGTYGEEEEEEEEDFQDDIFKSLGNGQVYSMTSLIHSTTKNGQSLRT